MKKERPEKQWWKKTSSIGDSVTVLAAVIAIVVTILDLFDLLDVGWFNQNLAKITLLLVSLVVISDVIERRSLITALSKLLDQKPVTELEPTNGFVQGVIDFLGQNQNYETLDILASTGTLYYYAFRDSALEVQNVRLLLRDTRDLAQMKIPSLETAKQNYKNELSQMIWSWKQMQKAGRIRKLEIKVYPFDPLFHFIIADGKFSHFGLFQPKLDIPGAEILNSYIVHNVAIGGQQLGNDLKVEFDTIWQDFAFELNDEELNKL